MGKAELVVEDSLWRMEGWSEVVPVAVESWVIQSLASVSHLGVALVSYSLATSTLLQCKTE